MEVARQSLDVMAQGIPLTTAGPDRERLGPLRYRGGLSLSAPHPAFGGLSGLWVAPDRSRFLAITDKGAWIGGEIDYAAEGSLKAVHEVEIGPLGELPQGRIADERGRDAEALTRGADGAFHVAFEGKHRILRYARSNRPPIAGPATRVATPDDLRRAKPNGGPEALAALGDGRLLMLVESLTRDDARTGFLRDRDGWHRVGYPLDADFKPTDAARLPDGDVLVLERRFDMIAGFQGRLRRVREAGIRPDGMLAGEIIATLKPPILVDNYEGLSIQQDATGRTFVYLVSDDNFRGAQRTLLLMFEYMD